MIKEEVSQTYLQVEGAAAKEKLETLESQNVCACSLSVNL